MAAQKPSTPVIADAHATSGQLLQRAARDYANAQAARKQDSTRDQPAAGSN